ncbi:MAG: peroxiredoxin family protein [Terracidiphilus sp.]
MLPIPKRIPCQLTRLFSHLLQLIAILALALTVSSAKAQTPAAGDKAPNFTLLTPTGSSISLASDTRKGTTVLVILRGFPGYQCPYCVRQVHDFAEHASDFAAKKVRVLFVYPGPPAALDDHAKEFLTKEADLPANIQLVVDPDYRVTNLYGLRWDAPHETAYPSAFILDKHRTIKFEKISHTHGDRTTAEDVLKQIG